MKSDRVMSVLMVLLEGKRMRAQDLADRLEVSVRTVYRDIDTLCAAGIPVRSIGGMTLTPDCDTETLPDDCAGLILVGGMSWATPEAERIVPLVREALSHGILVGAICNAASFLAAHGFLNGVRHTGNGLEMLREWGGANYTGEKLYQERQAVRDGNVVTANGSGYLEFTRECLLALEADTPEQIAASYAFNKHGFYRE